MLDTCGFKGRSQYTRWLRDIQYETALFQENGRNLRQAGSIQRIERCINCPSGSKEQMKRSFLPVRPESS
ncbi:hypothetical protein CQA29_16325 [Klebsiella pneumoniae]|uniref:Uncharacterized protein n=1 Tax=Klebsiella pneumoniae TaxID=573 RepID=A0AAX1BVW4_KLEPN|nr:hypothetical protein BB790_01015 [Klebsiella pneumoniae]AZI96967.1 hypothetical protein C5X33_01010 [Klebsiella pneumoniae subsp. pneumoniae]AUV37995.1 hypothetical protein C2U50_15150 [Klebsiella pneumoniae]AUY20155.1 hypothetical protein C3F39_16015 [Klebsiella pneumoniae]AYY22028.1 hypothetical protein EGY03_12785 [Klebsiella pneumoniae]